MSIFDSLEAELERLPESSRDDAINQIKSFLHKYGQHPDMPVDNVQWVPIEQVQANDYNPNSVARNEMRLLYVSIDHDGYTQPVVVVHDKDTDKYIIVDGFHRYLTMKTHKGLQEKTGGRLPVVVLDKPINDRMASTVRHNRARGKHSINGMANMVFEMLQNNWSDSEIIAELGMEPDELIRLKHITGFSKLFENTEYRKAWQTDRQIKIRKQWQNRNKIRGKSIKKDKTDVS